MYCKGMKMSNTVIEFKHVTKIYKLFKSDRQRFKQLVYFQ